VISCSLAPSLRCFPSLTSPARARWRGSRPAPC
jgi:hypothetical protein